MVNMLLKHKYPEERKKERNKKKSSLTKNVYKHPLIMIAKHMN